MPTKDGKMTNRELAMKYGGTLIPPDDPIFKQGFTIGATRPYRQPKVGSTPMASSTAQTAPKTEEDPMAPAVRSYEEGLAESNGGKVPE